jgi:hypothetical protein
MIEFGAKGNHHTRYVILPHIFLVNVADGVLWVAPRRPMGLTAAIPVCPDQNNLHMHTFNLRCVSGP